MSAARPSGETPMRFLPRSHVEAFVDPDEQVDGDGAVWVHRSAFGVFVAAPVEPRDGERHFNVPEPGTLRLSAGLELRLAGVEDEAARLIRERLPERRALAPADRELLELNARTLQRAHRFVLAPKPAIPL